VNNEGTEKPSIRVSPWVPLGHRRLLLPLALVFGISRLIYFALGVHPDTEPISYYWQYIDPALLRHHLWQSLLYLREQPPGFNLYLGLALKTASPDVVFGTVGLLTGLALALTLMTVMIRLGVSSRLAFLLTVLFTSSPITVLHENWVFYGYPVAVALTAGTWATERYIRAPRFHSGLLLFAALAIVVSIRGVYHLMWFLMLAALVLWVTRDRWRTGLAAMALPLILIGAFYVKNFVMFGDILPGEVYRKINYAQMIQEQAPPEVLARLNREGRIGGILQMDPIAATDSFAEVVKPPALTGAPLLDMWRKTTGSDNWHSVWRRLVVERFYRDAQVVAHECPGLLAGHLLENLRKYLLPASDVFPFDAAPNARCLRPFLTWYERISSGQLRLDKESDDDPIVWLNVVLFPACLISGSILTARGFLRRRDQRGEARSRWATLLFILFNIVWNSAVTILFSSGDHNRYREEVAPLYVVLVGLLASALWAWLRGAHARAVPSITARASSIRGQLRRT